MRYLKITLIFLATSGLVFIAASAAVFEIADLFEVTDWLGEADADAFHFNSAASTGLIVFAIACAFYAARKSWRAAGKGDHGKHTATRGRALALVQDDERQVMFRVPREDRRWGIILMAFGLFTCLLPVVLALAGKNDAFPMGFKVAIMGCLILGGLFLVVGCYMGLRADEIRFDPFRHAYTCRLGFPWSNRSWKGAIDEISRLELIGEEEETEDFKATVWRVCLIWLDATRQPIALTEFTHRFSTLRQDRRQLALDAMLKIASRINIEAYDELGNRLTADLSPGDS
jgi:hypothetical protein